MYGTPTGSTPASFGKKIRAIGRKPSAQTRLVRPASGWLVVSDSGSSNRLPKKKRLRTPPKSAVKPQRPMSVSAKGLSNHHSKPLIVPQATSIRRIQFKVPRVQRLSVISEAGQPPKDQ